LLFYFGGVKGSSVTIRGGTPPQTPLYEFLDVMWLLK
jgi:hypothetical protein